ncbi:MAG: transglutaminase-like domain-containing protein [Planctomycetota bacterium]
MRLRPPVCAILVAFLAALSCPTALGQFQTDAGPEGGIKLGESKTQRWRCGLSVEAVGGPCQGIVGYVPFPVEWPEQELKIVDEENSPQAKVSYENVEDAKLMVVRIANLAAGQTATATVTFEIRRSTILPPDATSHFKIPEQRKLDRRVLPYLGPSPLIESRDPKIRTLAKQIPADKEAAWEKVEAIYDWVREEVEYKNGPIKGALAALRDGNGDCEELTSLFIAICRAAGIPARTVWVPEHCYPEFYLIDDKGEGHWFPCQAAGSREFGGILETRPILQKGDNFRPPWNRKDQQRYLAEHLVGAGGRPKVKFIRDLLGEE